MKTILFSIVIVLAGIVGAADNPFVNVRFDNIGFNTPDGLIVVAIGSNKVSWPGGAPKEAAVKEYWDQIVLKRTETTALAAKQPSEVVNDWNALVVQLKDGPPTKDQEVEAAKFWKTIKTLFPHLFK